MATSVAFFVLCFAIFRPFQAQFRANQEFSFSRKPLLSNSWHLKNLIERIVIGFGQISVIGYRLNLTYMPSLKNTPEDIFIKREAREIMYLVASVSPFVCPPVTALTAEPFDLRP